MRRPSAHGFTLVELLAGLALGLVVVSAATAFAMTHGARDRQAAAQARLLRELRMASDVVTHDLRRAGHWPGVVPVAWSGAASAAPVNPHAALAPEAAASDAAALSYAGAAAGAAAPDDERLGFRLNRGVIEMMLGQGNWQALTDAASVEIVDFTVTPRVQALAVQPACAPECAAAAPDCGATQAVRVFAVAIRGRSTADPRIEREWRSVVRVRADRVVAGACVEEP